MTEEKLLEMKGISKSFPGVLALKNVNFSVLKGEIHALIGENGAGKSTLIKVLTGINCIDEGEIYFDSKKILPENSLHVQNLGISTIYQELNLIPYLTVAENIFIGREPRKNGIIDWSEIYRRAEELINGFGLCIDVRQQVNQLSTAFQQITAISRAVSVDAKLVIMDEPTSSLDKDEVEVLFDIIKKLKEKGVSVIFISHRLDELFEISDRITILRDGENVGVYETKEMNELKIVSLMIGRDASDIVNFRPSVKTAKIFGDVYLKTENISSGVKVSNMNLEIRQGEGLGLAGLLGSGRTEFLKIIFGSDKKHTGEIELLGKNRKMNNPTQAIKYKLAFLSENRKTEGIVPNMSVKENITLAMLPKISKMGIISRKKEEELVNKYIKSLNIKTPGMNQKIKNLSGGNQQKVLLARWLATEPRLIILDEPTRGIDVGAKAEIETIIKDLLHSGISVLMVSSEFDELIRNCDRVVVLRDGKKIAELTGQELSQQNIINCIAAGQKVFVGEGCTCN